MIRYAILFVLFFLNSNVNSASFDCSKANSITEKTICSNPELSNLDEKMALFYRVAIALSTDGGTTIRNNQRSWASLANSCPRENLDVCFLKLYTDQIKILQEHIDKNKGYFGMQIKGRTELDGESIGLVVDSVTDGGPAAIAGIRPNDVIVSVDSKTFKKEADLFAFANVKPQTTINLEVLRDSSNIAITITSASLNAINSLKASLTSNSNISDLNKMSESTSTAPKESPLEQQSTNNSRDNEYYSGKNNTLSASDSKSHFFNGPYGILSAALSMILTLTLAGIPWLLSLVKK